MTLAATFVGWTGGDMFLFCLQNILLLLCVGSSNVQRSRIRFNGLPLTPLTQVVPMNANNDTHTHV